MVWVHVPDPQNRFPKTLRSGKTIDVLQLEKELSEITGLKVIINFDNLKKAGNIRLECKKLSEFNYIIEKIKS